MFRKLPQKSALSVVKEALRQPARKWTPNKGRILP